MPSDLIERIDKALRREGRRLDTDALLRECREALAQGQKRVEKAAVMLGLKIAEIDALRAQLAQEQKACNHWFAEANRNHNDLMRANAQLAEGGSERPPQVLHQSAEN